MLVRRGARIVAPVVLILLVGCGAGLGSVPLVLTEVPNRPSGEAYLIRGAELSGCQVARAADRRILVSCAEGGFDVPVFAGPPTLAVRCVDERLRDPARCRALVRRLILAADPDAARAPVD